MRATSYNTICMMANQHIHDPQTPLRQLHNIATNQPIPGFPHSLQAVQDEREK